MQEDTIIQKNLFAIDNENNEPEEITNIPEDLSWEDLKKESQKRPRQRKNRDEIFGFRLSGFFELQNTCGIFLILRNIF